MTETDPAQILRQINDRTIRIDQALFGNRGSSGFISRTETEIEAQGKRITALEFWRWLLTGAGAVIGWILGHHVINSK